jgi:protein-S-isoprenylcysteine O-methyltransferase Ste14
MNGIFAVIIGGSWLIFAVVWLALAINVKQARKTESAASRVAHLLPLGLAFVILFDPLPAPQLLMNRHFMPQLQLVQAFGACLTAAGVAFAIWARVTLGRNWSASVMQKTGHELIVSGPFRIVRHPIYTGMLSGMLGPALVMGQWRCLFAVALAFATLWRKYRLEERFMVELFGEQYSAYQQHVPALIPLVA